MATKNIINRNFNAKETNLKGFIDSSCIKLNNNFNLGLCAIIDVYANKIVAWELSYSNDSDLAIKRLKSGINKYGAPSIIHADHRTNFLLKAFLKILNQYHIIQFNSRVANSLDNRPIEYVFVCLKYEWLYHVILNDYNSTWQEINLYVNGYNNIRIQSKLSYMSPNNYLSNFHQNVP